jgi:hypothetical protein
MNPRKKIDSTIDIKNRRPIKMPAMQIERSIDSVVFNLPWKPTSSSKHFSEKLKDCLNRKKLYWKMIEELLPID